MQFKRKSTKISMEIITFAMALFLAFTGCSRSANHQHSNCGNGTCEEDEDQFGCPADCGAVAISAAEHTCVVLSDGTARCWGSNWSGQLGNGTNTASNVPVAVMGLTGAVAISVGTSVECMDGCSVRGHTCVILLNGTAKCWGDNGAGQLGDGMPGPSRFSPVTVTGLTEAVAVSAGEYYTCALLSDGTARCWGSNWSGQLGNGTNTASNVPVAVTGLTGIVAVSAGEDHTCAVISDGTARCWGRNDYGQLGNGTEMNSNVPVAVTGLIGAVAVSAGGCHTCALLSDGTATCWGNNVSGQLGDGSNTNSNVPVAVTGLTGAMAISANDLHTCALLSDGTAKCWGWNGSGQLGDGTNTNSHVPVAVLGLAGAVAISAETNTEYIPIGGRWMDEDSCALLSDGTAWCWGVGYLGDGTNMHSNVPVPVAAW
jgi:alpha-tubulin suppressor-like RCC1 family protein